MFFNMPQENSFRSVNTIFIKSFSPIFSKSHPQPISQRINSWRGSFHVARNPYSSSLFTVCYPRKFNQSSQSFLVPSSFIGPSSIFWIALWKAQITAKDSSCLFRNRLLKDLIFLQILNEINIKTQSRNPFFDSPRSTSAVGKREVTFENTQLEDLKRFSKPCSGSVNSRALVKVPNKLAALKPVLSSLEIPHKSAVMANSLDSSSFSYNQQTILFNKELLTSSYVSLWLADFASFTQQSQHVLNYDISISKTIQGKNPSPIYPKKQTYQKSSHSFFPIPKNSYYISLLLTFLLYFQVAVYSLKDFMGFSFNSLPGYIFNVFYSTCEEQFSQLALYIQHYLHFLTLNNQLKDCCFLQVSSLNSIKAF
ncbi:hypothetical protein SOMG_01187 [Schizosaccharomyces osmophilus]|uniref:Transmembrane protein n=1 Tax=Schizosaccharomyces osmophilus TaxID=2545709 RepID=A0AAF0AVT3_9SCHI|nr:uncharacterized protein SOMG_01187 [Schizosaccharomyces osmophilus]WBW72798.1 hypothetical protein SOMG_01187 [Schizosaccharomyces osmophilus]